LRARARGRGEPAEEHRQQDPREGNVREERRRKTHKDDVAESLELRGVRGLADRGRADEENDLGRVERYERRSLVEDLSRRCSCAQELT